MTDIHEAKVRFLKSQGMEQRGVVLSQPDKDKPYANDVAIVFGGAVRWLSRSELWDLMHPEGK